jgi:hypothetical protein
MASLRAWIDKWFPDESQYKLLRVLAKATKKDKMAWERRDDLEDAEHYVGTYKDQTFDVVFKETSKKDPNGYSLRGILRFASEKNETVSIHFAALAHDIYFAILDQVILRPAKKRNEAHKADVNTAIRQVLSSLED